MSATTPEARRLAFMTLALTHAEKCIGNATAFCVGAVLVDSSLILATGYSREHPGNTHAEQVCIAKLLSGAVTTIPQVEGPEKEYDLYTTMEPCSKRLSGNIPCTDLIVQYNASEERREKGLGRIRRVYVGVREPVTFVKKNVGEEKLVESGVEFIHITGLEERILEVARMGH